jgi:uncharacterized protein YdgA (DUF945 family)
MKEAERLRRLARQCRKIAASTHTRPTAETLRDMARQFEDSALFAERLPMLKAYPKKA